MYVEEHARRVFLSHVSEDKEVVDRIAKMLVKVGVPVWYDAWEIGWGDRIVAKISCKSMYLFFFLFLFDRDNCWVCVRDTIWEQEYAMHKKTLAGNEISN